MRAGKHGRAFKIDYARALEMHEAGMPKEFIAAEFDVKPMSVHAALAKQGVTWRAGRPPGLRAIRSEEMKATIRKHLSRLRKLAARERNHGTLPSYSWLNANGFFRSYEVVSKAGLLKNFKRAYVR